MHKPTIAVLGAAVILTLGIGGGAYAGATITGADIVNGTVTTADIQDQTLLAKDLAPRTFKGRVLYSKKNDGPTWLSGTPAVVHSITVPTGKWLVSVSVEAFPHNEMGTPWAYCYLDSPNASSANTTATMAGADYYAALSTEVAVNATGDTTVDLTCGGTNAGVDEITLTAVEASGITDLSP